MKKYYSSPEYKKYNQIKTAKKHKRAKKIGASISRKSDGNIHKKDKPDSNRELKATRRKGKYEITVPNNFSVINNPKQMLEFFEDINYHARKRRNIFLEMSKIQDMTSDAILYMLSLFDYHKSVHRFSNISGNYPQNISCRNLLVEGGFLDYVEPKYQIKRISPDILSVKSNSTVQGDIASKVIRFSLSKLDQQRDSKSRGIYATLIECMANTIHHAYRENNPYTKWWLMALYGDNKVNFTFYDSGMGIPKTLKKNFSEKFFGSMFNQKNDYELIISALKGEFRTRTGDKWRGRGLPKINSFYNQGYINKLTLVSNYGYVNFGENRFYNMSEKFRGTLFSWDFVKQELG